MGSRHTFSFERIVKYCSVKYSRAKRRRKPSRPRSNLKTQVMILHLDFE